MRKLLGTIFLLILLYVGFCGVKIEAGGKEYNIPPFISNFIHSDKGKEVGKEMKDVLKVTKEAITDIADSDSVK